MKKDAPEPPHESPPRDRHAEVGKESVAASGSPPPLDALTFRDIFRLQDIQSIQDAFSDAANVAALITDPQGNPLTRPSRFSTFCQLIRSTRQGLANCIHSDAVMVHRLNDAPKSGRCLSAGLLDGGTGIFVGKRHLANWLIGQIVDEDVDTEACIAYAVDLGIDENDARDALSQLPRMSGQQFDTVCQVLHRFAKHLSVLAVENYQKTQLIHELRQAETNIKKRDRNLADIIDFLPDPTLVVDQAGSVVFWNRAMEKLTGVAAEDMLGKSGYAYGVPFYGTQTPLLIDYARGMVPRPDSRYAVAELEEDAIIAEVIATALPGGPRHIWAKAVALRDESGKISGAIETIRDVTDRHRTAQALRESEENFRRIVETANEGVWVFDVEYKTVFINRRMATMLGYTPEEMPGRALADFLFDPEAAETKYQQQRRRQGLSDVFEHRLKTRTGETIWVLISASPLYNAAGTYIGALGMFSDITARKQVEEALANQRSQLEIEVEKRTRDLQLQALELAEANIRLSELDRLKSVFLSTVSHELRTPLTSILGFAKLIGREFSDQFLPLATGNTTLQNKGKRIAANLNVVFTEAERLTRLINDVLDLNRIESGNVQWRDCCIAPRPVLEKASQSIIGLLEKRPGVSFVFDAPGDLPDLLIDPDQLIQVISNLLNNAVKFTKTGEVRLTLRHDETELHIDIRDSGIGIPSDELELIFDKFHQVGRGDTVDPEAKGTGLGLAICRQIVRHYGGRIWAESILGQGSVFHVRLPLAGEACSEKEVPPAAGRG